MSADGAVTIYDVAAAANVSPSTVSRTFARPGRVSAATAKRVRQVAADLGYRVDEVFRPVQSAPTLAIGMVVADITNPMNFAIIRGAEAAVAAQGYTLLLADAQEDDRREREVLRRMQPLMEALVVASSRVSDTDLRSTAKTIPVVVLNRQVGGLPCVLPDSTRGLRRAVEHLVELGHTRICYLSGPAASWIDGARWHAIKAAASECDVAVFRIGPHLPTLRAGVQALPEVLAKQCSAVITYNDLLALGLIRGLNRAGIAVPDDISVIGVDDIFAADLVSPALTTVAAPLVAIGAMAARNAIALAGGAQPTRLEPIIMPMRLVIRDSTGPAVR